VRTPVRYRLLAATIALALTGARGVRADDVLHPGAVVIDAPTVVTLGVQLLLSGDDDHDARVAVRYREVGTVPWSAAMDLFRVHPEDVAGRSVPEQFAGSIFDLRPATTYEIELHALDDDGPVDQVLAVQTATRALPADPQAPSPKPVANTAGLQAALAAAQPGDVITLADGTYQGPFTLAASGTAANPIVIRGAGTGAVLDGNGCNCNLLELSGSFVHVERLTAQDALRGIRFKTEGTQGIVVRRVHVRDVTIGMIGDPDQQDFYVCDNVVEGRLVWPHVYGDDGGQHASDDGINVKGRGHVVCHNQIVGFGDALKIEQDGARGNDFYGNEVLSAYDNGIELDTSEGNTRAFRNRFTNTFVPISFQPVFGGPVYALRNVVVNVTEDQLKFYALGGNPPREPSGVLVLYNTFVGPDRPLLMGSSATSRHFAVANNLFVGPDEAGGGGAVWLGPIEDGHFDYNGWFPDGTFDFASVGTWSGFAAMQSAGTFEAHGVLLGPGIFANGLVPPPTYQTTMAPQDVTLASGSDAVDAGFVLANLSDAFTGVGPDLGALERGCPIPLYGVRPAGIDETNEPTGCTGPTVTTSTTTSTTSTTLPWMLVRTSSLSLRDDAANPTRRRVTFKSVSKRDPTPNRIVPPAPGSSGDPTLGGATLTVYNAAGSPEAVEVALPATHWSATGSGYLFRNRDAALAITNVKVRKDQLVLKGGKAAWAYTLDEPAQGRVAVRLTLGSARPWCAEAPARTGASFDTLGKFLAQPNTLPPASCPAVP
jgi:hypothetical protein